MVYFAGPQHVAVAYMRVPADVSLVDLSSSNESLLPVYRSLAGLVSEACVGRCLVPQRLSDPEQLVSYERESGTYWFALRTTFIP